MGIVWPPEPEGSTRDCVGCFPAGKTPVKMLVTFNGIVSCNHPGQNEPPDQPCHIVVTQDAGNPCLWEGTDRQGYKAIVNLKRLGNSGCALQKGVTWLFDSVLVPICTRTWDNVLVCGFVWENGTGGTASAIPTGGVHDAAALYAAGLLNLTDEVIYKFEGFFDDNNDHVIRFANPGFLNPISVKVSHDYDNSA